MTILNSDPIESIISKQIADKKALLERMRQDLLSLEQALKLIQGISSATTGATPPANPLPAIKPVKVAPPKQVAAVAPQPVSAPAPKPAIQPAKKSVAKIAKKNKAAGLTVSQIIRRFISKRTAPFTVKDIKRAMAQSPGLPKFENSYINSQVWKMASRGLLTILRRGDRGSAGIYQVAGKPAPMPVAAKKASGATKVKRARKRRTAKVAPEPVAPTPVPEAPAPAV